MARRIQPPYPPKRTSKKRPVEKVRHIISTGSIGRVGVRHITSTGSIGRIGMKKMMKKHPRRHQ